MKAIFGVVSLLVVLALVGILAKKQLESSRTMPSVPGLNAPQVTSPERSTPTDASGSANTVQQQSQQLQSQVKQSVESALQQPRPMPDDK